MFHIGLRNGRFPPFYKLGLVSTPSQTGSIKVFPLPDLYQFYPEIVKAMDVDIVQRPNVLLYNWDEMPDWDHSPVGWSNVIGPEPILHSFTRVQQVHFEILAEGVRGLTDLLNPKRAPPQYLAYISSFLGFGLPPISEARQRKLVENLILLYRKKGTFLSYQILFRLIGYDIALFEKFQRKTDAQFVSGPQPAPVRTNLVLQEPQGTLIAATPGPYAIGLLNGHAVRGSVELTIYDASASVATVVRDDGKGNWIDPPGVTGFGGTIDYQTGAGSVTLPASPVNVGGKIFATYRFLSDQFPDPYKRRWTDRFKSSYCRVQLTPIDPTIPQDAEISSRILSYLDALKPIHVVFDEIQVELDLRDVEGETDDIDPRWSMLFVETPWDGLWCGDGYALQDNGSQTPGNPSVQHRTGHEYILSYNQLALQAAGTPQAPYAYPRTLNGRFHNQLVTATKEYIGGDVFSTYAATLTNDIAPTTTHFSIQDTGASVPASILANAGFVVFASPSPQRGEQRTIQTIVSHPGYYEITVTSGFPLTPQVGDPVTLLEPNVRLKNRFNLRPIDPVSFYWVEDLFTGNAVTVTFNGTLHFFPTVASNVLLRFTIGGVSYEEKDDGVGGFSNTSGKISAAAVNYTTGVVSVTFTNPPDNLTKVTYVYGQTGWINVGTY